MVDPATIAKASKLAIDILRDEESRRKLVIIMLSPLITSLLIITAVYHILESPFEAIKEFFGENDYAMVEDFKLENDYIVAPEIGVIEGEGEYPMPVSGARVSSPYGNRIHPVTHKLKFHTGIDLCPEWHSPVMSIAPGKIVRTGLNIGGYGQYIIVQHDIQKEVDVNGSLQIKNIKFFTVYAHLSAVKVTEGQVVDTGSVIGLEGGDPKRDLYPGRTTGHHLHFEVRKSMDPHSHVDPTKYIFANPRQER